MKSAQPVRVNRSAGGFSTVTSAGGCWAFRLVVEEKQQAEDVHGANGSQQASGLLILGGTQRPTDGEGAVEQIAEGGTGFQATEVRRNPGAVQGQVVDQALDEIAAVDGCPRLPTQGSAAGVTVMRYEC